MSKTSADRQDNAPRVARGGILSDADAFIDTALALTDLAHDEPEEAVHRIAGELRDLTGSRFCAIYMVERSALRPVTVNEHGAILTELEQRRCPLKDLPAAKAVVKDSQPASFERYGLPLCRVGFDDDKPRTYEAAMLLPMVVKRRVIGLVEICDSVARDFDAERVIVERLVKVATRAVVWAGDARRLTARELVATELLELGDFIARAHSLSELVRPICENLRKVIGAEDCDIWQCEGDNITCLGSADSNGWDPSVIGDRYPLSDYPSCEAALRAGSVRVVASRDAPSLGPSELEALEKWGYHSNLCLPLLIDDVAVGFIDIFDTRQRDYAEHLEFVRNVGRMLAGAFHRVIVAEQLERRNAEMQVLLDVSRALGSAALHEDALAIVARKAGEALGLASCLIHEYVPELDSLIVRANYDRDEGESHDGLGVATQLDEMPGDRAVLVGGEIVVVQVSDPELAEETRRSMEHWGEKTCLNVPLWFKGQPIGMMLLLESAQERYFNEGELDLARAIGEQAAMAIQNARLYRSLKQKSETDKLTGLHNSRYFRQRVTDEVARACRHHLPVSLFIADVDDLRRFSVAAGRQLANELLTTVGDLIRARLHVRVDVAARLGGRKFAVLLPNTPLEGEEGVAEASSGELDEDGEGPHRHGALGVAERLRREVEALTILAAGARLPQEVTISIGVVEFSAHMANAEAFMDAAEDAVGRAQKAGKNRVETAG